MIPKNLFLWGHPRSLSTAMEVYFRTRGDFQVIHEPFADCYWKGTSSAETLEDLLDKLSESDQPVFVKDIAHHLPEREMRDPRLISAFSHLILVRSPLPTFHSHLKVNPEVKDHEFGYQTLYEVYELICQRTGKAPDILLADELLSDAESAIVNLCANLGIEHIPEALSWQPSPQSDWKAAEKWQATAGASSGFEPASRIDFGALPKRVEKAFGLHQESYNKLKAAALLKSEPGPV